MPKLIWTALGFGTIIAALLLILETVLPGHAPRAIALPGWIAVIFFWGFEGGRGPGPWIIFSIANTIAYSMLGFFVLVLLRIVPRRSGRSK